MQDIYQVDKYQRNCVDYKLLPTWNRVQKHIGDDVNKSTTIIHPNNYGKTEVKSVIPGSVDLKACGQNSLRLSLLHWQ